MNPFEREPSSVDELFGNLKKGPLKDVFESFTGKKLQEAQVEKPTEEPKWPSVRVNK